METTMSFREKKAWVTMIALVVVFLPFFYLIANAYHRPEPNYAYLTHLVLIAFTTFLALEVILVLAARYLSPEDAGIPKDERDQLFAFRAARSAYIALILLIVLVTIPMIHMEGRNWGWGMAYLGAIIGAECLRAIALIVQYRRGY